MTDTHDDDDFDTVIDDDDDDDTTVSKEEHERTKAALKRANAEAKKWRLRSKDLAKQSTNTSDDDKKDDKDNTRARELERQGIREEAAEETASKYKTKLLNRAAAAALLQAGLTGDAKKLAKLVSLEDVDVDDDGDVDEDMLDEAVEKIKDDYPELFRDKEERQRTSTRRSRIDGGDRGRPASRNRPLSSAEKIQAQALGRRPR